MSFQYYEPNPAKVETLKPIQKQPISEPPPAYTSNTNTGNTRSPRSYINMHAHASFASGSQPYPEPQTNSSPNSTPARGSHAETNFQPTNPFLACIFCPVTTLYACCICDLNFLDLAWPDELRLRLRLRSREVPLAGNNTISTPPKGYRGVWLSLAALALHEEPTNVSSRLQSEWRGQMPEWCRRGGGPHYQHIDWSAKAWRLFSQTAKGVESSTTGCNCSTIGNVRDGCNKTFAGTRVSAPWVIWGTNMAALGEGIWRGPSIL
ncbi:hypothetical protein C8R47DRAFT_1203056 [Mycena vitilis]|nr:hypothetical protein C8R47DRAFT_1203056 [Mycena vitilis]